MSVHVYLPSPSLSPFVKNYVIVDCATEMINKMLPDTSLILGFRFKGVTRYLNNQTEESVPLAVVAGLRKSVQVMRDMDDTSNLLVILQDTGAHAFIKEPLDHVFGSIVGLRDCERYHNLDEVEERLSVARNNKERITIIESFLLSKIQRRKTDPLITFATGVIKAHNGLIKVNDLSSKCYLSLDAFEKRFKKNVGASPKQYAYIVRMSKAVGMIQHTTLVDTALTSGYYDQSHFNKDFKLYTGQTPTEYLKSASLENR